MTRKKAKQVSKFGIRKLSLRPKGFFFRLFILAISNARACAYEGVFVCMYIAMKTPKNL